jgi:hypothetical protein
MRSTRNKTLRSPLSMVKVISQEADCEQPEEAGSLNSTRRPWHFLPLCCLYLVKRRPRITKLKDPTTRPVWSPIFRSLNYQPSMAMKNKGNDKVYLYVLNDEGLWVVSKPADRQPAQTESSSNYGAGW